MTRSRAGWRQRRVFLERWIAANGYVCPGLDGIPHQAVSLGVDHVVPVALGGSDRDGLRVLCSNCNRSAGAKLGKRAEQATASAQPGLVTTPIRP